MSERIFLEDIAKPYNVSPLGNARTWKILYPEMEFSLPPLIYVVESQIGQQFLLGREKSGRAKFNMVRYLAQSIIPLFLEQLKGKDLFQYLILREAYPFDLQHAFGFSSHYQHTLIPTAFIIYKDNITNEINKYELNTYQGNTWLIPYPILNSGRIIASFLKDRFQHHLPKEVYLFTLCGSGEALNCIYKECEKTGVELIPVYSQCIFKMSESLKFKDNPSFSVLNQGSITTKLFFEKASHRFQEKLMCSVGNFEESLYNPIQYSINTLMEMMALGMDPKRENWEGWSINVKGDDFQKILAENNPSLLDYFKESWKE